jgi:hypothetical protein
MSDHIQDTANKLLQTMDDKNINKEVSALKNADPMLELKSDILKFFKSHIERIESQEKLRSTIQEELLAQIERGEVNFDQLHSLFNSVSKQETTAAEAIISIFKPTPGSPSTLADVLGGRDDVQDEYEQAYENMSSEDMQKVDKLYRMMKKLLDDE